MADFNLAGLMNKMSGGSVSPEVEVENSTSSLAASLPSGLGKPGTGTTVATPLSSVERLQVKISELQAQLQTNAPGYASLLHEIHRALKEDETLVHLLSEQQIGTIVAGLSKRKGVVIAEATVKKTTSKSLSKLTADDF
jgi:acetylglutamate synthase